MIFLIQYDPQAGKIIYFETFRNDQGANADAARLEVELKLQREGGIDHEVVLFEAESEEALRQTHRRYFESAGDLLRSR